MLNIRLHTFVGKITDDGLDFPRTVQKRLSGDPIAKKFSTYKIQIRTYGHPGAPSNSHTRKSSLYLSERVASSKMSYEMTLPSEWPKMDTRPSLTNQGCRSTNLRYWEFISEQTEFIICNKGIATMKSGWNQKTKPRLQRRGWCNRERP